MDIPESPTYIVKVMPTLRQPADDVFQLYQVVEYAEALDADNATTILEELVHLAAHLDLRTNPLHNELAGTALAQHYFERRFEPFDPPTSGRGLLVVDLVRSYVHVHKDAVWPQPSLFAALRRLGFEVARTRGRWRPSPYQNLWQSGSLAGSHPRSPLAVVEREQEPILPIWTNPRFCREVHIPYPTWPPQPASPEMLAHLAHWSPQADVVARYEPALARLNPASEAHVLGRFLANHDAEELGDWFERFAPRCYGDGVDPEQVLSTVLLLEDDSADGEVLAGALVRLAAKMRRLGYVIPREK